MRRILSAAKNRLCGIQKHPAVLEKLAGMKIQKAVRARLRGRAVLFLPLKEGPDNLR